MTTPTPATSSTGGMSLTTPSPLAILSKTTPRGSSIALSSLQALPETQLVLVLLDHPTIRRKWKAVVVPLVESISKKLNAAYAGSRLTIGCVVYRPTVDKSLLRPAWTLSRTKMRAGSKLIASHLQGVEEWLGPDRAGKQPGTGNDADPTAATYSLIDGRSTVKPTAHVLEAFVAALELLQPTDNGIHNPLAPKKSPVMARHLLHVCLDSANVSLDLASPPFFNADAANDRVNAPTVGAKLARLGVSISSCAVKSDAAKGTAAAASKEALAAILGLHKSVSEPNKLVNEDLAALLPESVRAKIFTDANIISSGLTPSSAARSAGTPAAASTPAKRGREDEADTPSTPVKRSKSGSISQPQPSAPSSTTTAAPASSTAPGAAPSEVPRNIKLDPSTSTKVLFLKSQQETMIRNWAAAYAAVSKAEAAGEPAPSKAPGMNKVYLEQLKAQLMTQQQALKMLVHRIVSGLETAPNFNVSLQSLINIDKEAKEMGVNLGGPSNGGAALARQGRSGSFTSVQPPPVPASTSAPRPPLPAAHPLQSNAPAQLNASDAVVNNATASSAAPQAGAAPPSQTRPKPFWRGALTWSVISDPVTKQKRDVATLVSATSNSAAMDRLLVPWPDKLQITAITQLAPRNLQVYAQSQNAPYILFATQEAGPQEGGSGPVLTPAMAEKNKQMYSSLASSLDAKKSCAFVRHGSAPGAGLVLFATTQPTSSAERSGKGPVPAKLIGVVLKDPIPFSKLLAAQSGQPAPQGQLSQQQQQGGGSTKGTTPQSANRSRGASASGSMPDANQGSQPAQRQNLPPVSAPQAQPAASGMGLGSSMPFNLAALNAAGNVPVSGVGASAGIGAGLGLGANLGSGLGLGVQQASAPASNNLGAMPNLGNIGNLANIANLGNFGLGNVMGGGQQQQQQPAQDTFQNTASSGAQQPNLAALAQLLGIGGQAGGGGMPQQQQQQQQPAGSQPQPAFSQGLAQLFGQMAAFSQPQPAPAQQVQQQQQQQPQQGLFNSMNPFGVTAVPQQQQQPQQSQQQQQQQGGGDAAGGGGAGGGGMDFSKPMTMEQLRALGFIN